MSVDKGLKITWITYLFLDLSLSKTSRIEILRNMAKKGHEVELIVVRSRIKPILHDINFKITIIPLREYPVITPVFFGFLMLFYLPFYIIKNKPDYIISDPFTFNIGFLWKPVLRPFYNFKAVLDIRSTLVYPTIFKKFNFALSMFLAKTVFDGITIITDEMKQEVSKVYQIDPSYFGIWSDGVAIDLFSLDRNLMYRSLLRKKFSLCNRFIIMYHGDLTIERGILECVKAIAITRRKYPEITLFLLGGGKAVPQIRDLVRKENLHNNVILFGPVSYEKVPNYIAMADIGIVPLPDYAIWRNQRPLKLLEYLSMQKPVIATDIHANKNVAGSNSSVHFISDTDPVTISTEMLELYENRTTLEQEGLSGRKLVEKCFSWEKPTLDFENYLKKISRI